MSALPRRRFTISRVTPDDAAACADVLRSRLGAGAPSGPDIAGWVQTGREAFAAQAAGTVAAMVRHWSDEGVDHFDHLASVRPWAGLALVRFLGRYAQDRGIRLVRTTAPDEPIFEDYFGYSGFRPIRRVPGEEGGDRLVFERRVPLLTVREMRRSDAVDLARLTGGHPWDFEQRIRPGWFVLADGDSFAGFVAIRETTPGGGLIGMPVLLEGYGGRRLELWMIERAVHYAETHGIRSLELPAEPELEAVGRDLEDAGWVRSGQNWSRALADSPTHRLGGYREPD